MAALFSAAMVLSVTACGSETAEEKGTVSDSSKEEGGSEKIELSVSHIMVNESDSQVAAWNKALGEYKETHPDIVIKEDKADNDAYKTKLKTTLAAGSASDIFYSWGGGFSESFVEAGIVENLDSYVESGVIDMDKMMLISVIIFITMIRYTDFRLIVLWVCLCVTRNYSISII